MDLSGAVGATTFKYNGNYLVIFHDNHDPQEYCPEHQKYISDFAEDLIKRYDANFFVEEPTNTTTQPNLYFKTPHLTEFAKFYTKYKNKASVIPIDIRHSLFGFSNMSVMLLTVSGHYTVTNKLQKLLNLYPSAQTGGAYNWTNYRTEIDNHFNKIYQKLIDFQIMFLNKNPHMPLSVFVQKHKPLQEDESYLSNFDYPFYKSEPYDIRMEYEWLQDAIMEFYTIYKILDNQAKTNVLYVGFIHGQRIANILNKHYNLPIAFTNNSVSSDISCTKMSQGNLSELGIKN